MELLAITRCGILYRFPIHFDGNTAIISGYKARDYVTVEIILGYRKKVAA